MVKEKTVKIKITGLTQRQTEIARDIINTPVEEVKYYICRASRKAGKTYMLSRLLLYFSIKEENTEVGFVSASWSFTQNFYRDFIALLPKQLVKKANYGTSIELTNGSIVDFYSANSNILPVNRTFQYLVCDEFALYRKEVWAYLRPTVLAKRTSKVVIASTPRGKNAFYDLCQDGLNNRGRVRHYRMSYLDNPNIDLQDIEDARLSTPKQLFDQEYNSEFTDGVSGVFGDFKKLLTLIAWKEPKPEHPYWFGIDVAGVGDDETVLTIINHKGEVQLIYECVSGDLVEQADELWPIILKYQAKGLVEKNGIGQGLADILKSKLPSGFVKYWNTSNESKQRIVTGAILNINKGELTLPSDRLCPKLENEMSTFIGKRTSTGLITYSAEKGLHDDHVFSLLFANEARKTIDQNISTIMDMDDENNMLGAELIKTGEAPMSYTALIRQHQTWADNLVY